MFLLLFFMPIRAEALLLFTRDWGRIPELGSGWKPQTAEVFEKSRSLNVVVSEGGSDSTQVGCMESSDADEITAWLPKGDLKAHEFIRGMKGHFPTQPQAPSENRSKTLVF